MCWPVFLPLVGCGVFIASLDSEGKHQSSKHLYLLLESQTRIFILCLHLLFHYHLSVPFNVHGNVFWYCFVTEGSYIFIVYIYILTLSVIASLEAEEGLRTEITVPSSVPGLPHPLPQPNLAAGRRSWVKRSVMEWGWYWWCWWWQRCWFSWTWKKGLYQSIIWLSNGSALGDCVLDNVLDKTVLDNVLDKTGY